MEIIKKYTAIQVNSKKINDNVIVEFEYGRISGPYYDETRPVTEFNTEEEAIEWAYTENEYANWLIVPIINFKTQY